MSLPRPDLEQFVADLAAVPEQWRLLVRHRSDTRVYAQIWDEHDVNAWVICWSADQDTGFHDHDDSAAAIAVVAGRVREERLRLGEAPRSRLLEAGGRCYVPPTAIHRVLHEGAAPAITIHAYSPPLRRTGAYRIGRHGELERIAQPYEHELRAEHALG